MMQYLQRDIQGEHFIHRKEDVEKKKKQASIAMCSNAFTVVLL